MLPPSFHKMLMTELLPDFGLFTSMTRYLYIFLLVLIFFSSLKIEEGTRVLPSKLNPFDFGFWILVFGFLIFTFTN